MADSQSSQASQERGYCSTCHRAIALTASGVIHCHGPRDSRCQGSGLPPGSSVVATTILHSAKPQSNTSQQPPVSNTSLGRFRGSIIKRIPKASRNRCGKKLAAILGAIVADNSYGAWYRLLRFGDRCLRKPRRGGKRWQLASVVNQQIDSESDPIISGSSTESRSKHRKKADPLEALADRVAAKLEEGDYKGAVRLAYSNDSMASNDEATYIALQQKHPAQHLDSSFPIAPSQSAGIEVSGDDMIRAINSFPAGSAGGPDGLQPQHFKDLIAPGADDSRQALVPALVSFTELVLNGKTPAFIRPFFFGATLIALEKKGGGVRPIAVGGSLRRLIAKVAGMKVMNEMGGLLAPVQLGYGVHRGAEAAVHAASLYIKNLGDKCVLKLDFKNAFNSVRRDKMLEAVQSFAPSLFPFVHSVYSSPSKLFWEDKIIESAESVQQGDPLGPLLFCLTIHQLCSCMKSELSLLYLDDGTLGGKVEDVLHDLDLVELEGAELGLILNHQKSEIISSDNAARGSVLCAIPGARVIDPEKATLLGSPVGDIDCISAVLEEQIGMLKTMGERLKYLFSHDAILLLRHSFAIPKLLYNLRTSPCFLSPKLQEYDNLLRSIVSSVVNILFGEDDPAWTQATLTVKSGGLESGAQCSLHLLPIWLLLLRIGFHSPPSSASGFHCFSILG